MLFDLESGSFVSSIIGTEGPFDLCHPALVGQVRTDCCREVASATGALEICVPRAVS